MAKIEKKRGTRGFIYVKELGGAPKHQAVSRTAQILVDRGLSRGRVLDSGCGHGFDADHFGWEAYDPYYRTATVTGPFDTIVCNHVANVLTRRSREDLFERIGGLLADQGRVYISVSRSIPRGGKAGPRRRIQNYVVLTLPSVHRDEDLEIYEMAQGTEFEDRTLEFELTLM